MKIINTKQIGIDHRPSNVIVIRTCIISNYASVIHALTYMSIKNIVTDFRFSTIHNYVTSVPLTESALISLSRLCPFKKSVRSLAAYTISQSIRLILLSVHSLLQSF